MPQLIIMPCELDGCRHLVIFRGTAELVVVAVGSVAAGVGVLTTEEVMDTAGGAEANSLRTDHFRVLLVLRSFVPTSLGNKSIWCRMWIVECSLAEWPVGIWLVLGFVSLLILC